MRIVKTVDSLKLEYKKLLYMCNTRPVFKPRALFSDATENYRIPPECEAWDTVRIRLRVGRFNIERAYLYVDNEEYAMVRVDSDVSFDYYEAAIEVSDCVMSYYFKVEGQRGLCYYYNQMGGARELNPYYNFTIIPGHKVPKWVKGAVMYQIYVDRFCDGDTSNNVVDDEYSYIGEHVIQVKDWDKYPEQMGVREFYGGDLQGVWDKLDYLQDLGIDVIYFNPIFVSPSNHKYDTQDYDYVDPHIGVIKVDEGEVLKEGDQDNRHATKYISRVTSKENLEASNAFFF